MKPIRNTPFHVHPKHKDQVINWGYAFHVSVTVPIWRKVTRLWRYPRCCWPVKPYEVLRDEWRREGRTFAPAVICECTWAELHLWEP